MWRAGRAVRRASSWERGRPRPLRGVGRGMKLAPGDGRGPRGARPGSAAVPGRYEEGRWGVGRGMKLAPGDGRGPRRGVTWERGRPRPLRGVGRGMKVAPGDGRGPRHMGVTWERGRPRPLRRVGRGMVLPLEVQPCRAHAAKRSVEPVRFRPQPEAFGLGQGRFRKRAGLFARIRTSIRGCSCEKALAMPTHGYGGSTRSCSRRLFCGKQSRVVSPHLLTSS